VQPPFGELSVQRSWRECGGIKRAALRRKVDKNQSAPDPKRGEGEGSGLDISLVS
jgi:hypothetical protein